MTATPISTHAPNAHAQPAGCPVDHTTYSRQKTAPLADPATPALARDAAGVWHVRGYAEARQILRGTLTRQAGFKADLIERMPDGRSQPILYQEGPAHLQQRKQTARFFTPTATSANYRALMETLSDEILAGLRPAGRADLSTLSMRLAVRVAAQVVGLTDSTRPGMDRRLDSFFRGSLANVRAGLLGRLRALKDQLQLLLFFQFDVKPAIAARRRQPQADVISYLLEQGRSDTEILTECITFGAAGMATTREFISVAAWHFLEQPALRARYLAAEETARHDLLQEMLRLEPVIGHLYRRATADLALTSGGETVTIPAGDLIDLHVYAANADEAVVGEQPLAICPERPLHADKVTPAVLSFGDGHHRCPGAYIAIQETDIFLQRLLALPDLRIERAPTVTWNDVTKGYELREFIIAAGAAH
jgi:cytochrome P450